PYPLLKTWFDAAEASLTASLGIQTSMELSKQELTHQARLELENLLGEVMVVRANLQTFWEDQGLISLSLSQQALSLLSAENAQARVQAATTRLFAFGVSSANNVVAAIESGLQAISIAQTAKLSAQAIALTGITAYFMSRAGKLHEAYQLARQVT